MQIIKVSFWDEVPSNYTGIAEYEDATKEWYLNGKLHRIGGPAVEWYNGTKIWLHKGKYHREDGPAIERPTGFSEYWYDNERTSKEAIELLTYITKLKTIF